MAFARSEPVVALLTGTRDLLHVHTAVLADLY
jgi:hypothetical protein